MAVPWILLLGAVFAVYGYPSNFVTSDRSEANVFGQSIDGQHGFSLELTRSSAPNAAYDLQRRSIITSSNNNWWVTIGIGTPPQRFNVLPLTSASGFSVQSTLLAPSARGRANLYDPSRSSTARQLKGYIYSENVSSGYLDKYKGVIYSYSDSGIVYQDTATLGPLSIPDVSVLVMNHVSSIPPNDKTGNLGLGPDSTGQATSPKRVPTFMQSIRSCLSKGIATFSYDRYTLTGELAFGSINTARYTGDLVYVPNKPGSTLWNVQFDGMVVNGKLQKIPFRAVIDSGIGSSMVPRAALDAYFAQVLGARFDAGWGTYLFPCNTTLPDMIFAINGLALRIPKASWLGDPIGDSNICGSSILPRDSQAVLGETFLEGAFVVFDFDNLQVGFANRPVQTTSIPAGSAAGTTYFCTGADWTGRCQNMEWVPERCNSLQDTPFHHNIGAFGPNHGGCTLYSDTRCTSPLSDSINVHNPGKYDAGSSGRGAGSYMCLYPNDYPPQGSGSLTMCSDVNLRSGCQTMYWNSYVCNPIPAALKNNVASAEPSNGYCYTYTDAGCTNSVQGSAPFTASGATGTLFGSQIQSFMCL